MANQMNNNDLSQNWYSVGFSITAFIAFIISWIYCIATYGFFIGVSLGWIPSCMIAFMAGLFWPVIWLGIAVLLLFVFHG